MGNSSAKEERDADSPSPAECGGGAHADMAQGRQSPPRSHGHGAFVSPLTLTPQMRKLEELSSPSPPWISTGAERGIPTLITWSYGGKEVTVEGSWDGYRTRKPLQRSGKDFTIMKVLPSGVYHYRFGVDGEWRYSPDHPWEQDESGNAFNILDLQDYIPEDTTNISYFEPPESPESSYNNSPLIPDDFSKEPPIVPPQLNMSLLNAFSAHSEILPPHTRPSHVVLEHVYMQRDENTPSVVAFGSTIRIRNKYVTMVLYTSRKR